jgi:hypothetical protein
VEQKGDYALALKGNQGTLHDDVVLLLNDPEAPRTTMPPVVEADHGRIETRTATVSTEIGWLQKQHQWPGLKAIGKVERKRETAEKTTTETAYYLLSSELTAYSGPCGHLIPFEVGTSFCLMWAAIPL